MNRREFLAAMAVAPAVAARAGMGARSTPWAIGTIIGEFPQGAGNYHPAYAGDVLVGVWDGRQIVRHGLCSARRTA